MKKFLCVGLLVVLAFVGCEEGLTSNDEGLTEDEKFSFSKMHSDIKELREEIERLKSSNTVAVSSRVAVLESTLEGVTRGENADGYDTITFSRVNVQIVSGSGTTDGTINGLGNLIVGYNESRDSGSNKSGSHNIVVGSQHNYTSYGGLVAGYWNTISGEYSSVSGGGSNTASGYTSSVSGGYTNTASGHRSSVSGGQYNTAGGNYSSVSGGGYNTAGAYRSSVSGGYINTAGGYTSSVSGGQDRNITAHYNIY